MAEPRIAIDHVSKSYGAQKALDDVSLTIGAGEFVALVGASGSGKTTLLKTINRLIAPDAGAVRIEGEEQSEGGAGVPPGWPLLFALPARHH